MPIGEYEAVCEVCTCNRDVFFRLLQGKLQSMEPRTSLVHQGKKGTSGVCGVRVWGGGGGPPPEIFEVQS